MPQSRPDNITLLMKLLRPYRAAIVEAVVFTLVMAAISSIVPLISAALVDKVFTNGEMDLFLVLGACYVLAPIVQHFLGAFQATLCILAAVLFTGDLRSEIYQRLLTLSLRFFQANSAGKVANRVMEDAQTLVATFNSSITMTISDGVIAVIAILVTFSINWRLAILLCIVVLVFVINYRLSIRRIVRFTRLMRREDDALTGGVQNRMAASIAVKTFGTEPRENEIFHGHNISSLNYSWTREIANNDFWMNVSLIAALSQAVLYFCGCALVLKGEMTYGEVLAFNLYSMQLIWPGVRFSHR